MWIFCSFCVMIEKSGKSAGKEKEKTCDAKRRVKNYK